MLKKKELRMKIATHLVVTVTALILCVSCSRPPEAAVIVVYHDGNEYHIVDRGDAQEEGQPAYFVRYYSKDPGNDIVLDAERADLYAIIAKHIDTNEHQRVVLISTEEKGRLFGLMKPREIRVSSSVEEVLVYKP
jgi:hypothetical protein